MSPLAAPAATGAAPTRPARSPGPGRRRGGGRGGGDRDGGGDPGTGYQGPVHHRACAADPPAGGHPDRQRRHPVHARTWRAAGRGAYPAYPHPGQEVHVRVGPAVGSDGKVYKDGEYSFKMPSETALHDYINNYTANLDQGGLQLSGTAMAVNHFNHTWRACHSTFVLGFALDATGIRAEIAIGQFTV